MPGTVDPNGAATTYYVEYGTTNAYGLRTPDRNAGAGDAPVAISVNLSGLTVDTTYHFRLVATNAAGIGRSANRTLRTARPTQPRPPAVTTGPVRDLAPRSVALTGTVNPRGLATRYRFEYGTGTRLNRRTALVAAGAGTAAVPVAAALTLSPDTRYRYRLLATSSAGTTRGRQRSFTSPRAPAALTFALQSNRVPYEGTVVAAGSATSAGAGGVDVVLERQPFPFSGPFHRVASTRSASDGGYSFTVPRMLLSVRLRVVARTTPAVTSVARTVRTTARVGLVATRGPVRRVRFSGTVRPAVSGARASLQRRVRGRFVTLRRANVRPEGRDRSRYRITIAARRTASVYRVIVTPLSSSGHARGVSREQPIAGLRRGR
ncbi:MAG: fibronectin type III domain-containing protein [Solirubrobacteraceae bacterium]|nr:fibronectin type III domain-containing protein [Solirubrobacteraceae bacterium]